MVERRPAAVGTATVADTEQPAQKRVPLARRGPPSRPPEDTAGGGQHDGEREARRRRTGSTSDPPAPSRAARPRARRPPSPPASPVVPSSRPAAPSTAAPSRRGPAGARTERRTYRAPSSRRHQATTMPAVDSQTASIEPSLPAERCAGRGQPPCAGRRPTSSSRRARTRAARWRRATSVDASTGPWRAGPVGIHTSATWNCPLSLARGGRPDSVDTTAGGDLDRASRSPMALPTVQPGRAAGRSRARGHRRLQALSTRGLVGAARRRPDRRAGHHHGAGRARTAPASRPSSGAGSASRRRPGAASGSWASTRSGIGRRRWHASATCRSRRRCTAA